MTNDIMLQMDGVTIACHTEGPNARAPWIIFSNSLVTDMSIWDAQVDVLKQTYNILRYDQRGHGRSSVSTSRVTFDQLGNDIHFLMNHFEIPTCIYVGLSMGVPTGLRAFQQNPSRFHGLVFVDGMAKTSQQGAAGWQKRIEFVMAEGMEKFAAATAERWLRPDTLTGQKAHVLKAMISATKLDGFIQCAQALQNYDYTATVEEINIPLLAISGAEDGAIPAIMEEIFGDLPNADIQTIDKAGHVPNFERPEKFNATLLKFLEKIK